jgi:hypothetical protein
MKYKKFLSAILFLVAITVGFTACNDDDDDKGDPASLKVTMSNTVTANREYSEVNLDIQQISINASTDTNATSGWVDLETNAGVYNLLDFVSGNDTLLAFDTVLVAQSINQIRLILGENNTVVEDGVTSDLNTPSGQTSGIKVSVNAILQPGYPYMIELDFDPYQSVVKTGNGNYNLKPVIKATVIQL